MTERASSGVFVGLDAGVAFQWGQAVRAFARELPDPGVLPKGNPHIEKWRAMRGEVLVAAERLIEPAALYLAARMPAGARLVSSGPWATSVASIAAHLARALGGSLSAHPLHRGNGGMLAQPGRGGSAVLVTDVVNTGASVEAAAIAVNAGVSPCPNLVGVFALVAVGSYAARFKLGDGWTPLLPALNLYKSRWWLGRWARRPGKQRDLCGATPAAV